MIPMTRNEFKEFMDEAIIEVQLWPYTLVADMNSDLSDYRCQKCGGNCNGEYCGTPQVYKDIKPSNR